MEVASSPIVDRLAAVSTATVTTVMFKRGIRNISFRGVAPLKTGQPRVAGPAFTMRFLPTREDLSSPAAWSSPTSTRAAVEAMPPGSIVVIDAMGRTNSGVLGDILCARLKVRGARALVTDGAVRDREGIVKTGLPIWSKSVAAPPAVSDLLFVGWGDPVACGGVPVLSGDMILLDEDGGIVIPGAHLADVIEEAETMEAQEEWVLNEVLGGHPLTGIYPMSEESRRRYEDESK